MELSHTFTIPVPIEQAWDVLLDVERIAPCMPGASLESASEGVFRGKVKVKVGPIQVTYQGTARIIEQDRDGGRVVMEASGKEARGSGTARATVTSTLVGKGDETEVRVDTDLAITGRPAQFGRGVMADVAEKLLGQFADCLAEELVIDREASPEEAPPGREDDAEAAGPEAVATGREDDAEAAGPEAVATGAAAATGRTLDLEEAARRPRPSAEAIDLLEVAGAPVAKRLAPVVVAAAVLLLIVWLVRRRR